MDKIKCSLCFKKKQAKRSIFASEIALRVECSDTARNSYFPADFLSVRLQCSPFVASLELCKDLSGLSQGAVRAVTRNSTDNRSEL
jgi:hypothetical protein